MKVLVLNAGYEPLHTVSVPHAIRMLVRQVETIIGCKIPVEEWEKL